MSRSFTKYPQKYVKASSSVSRDALATAILDAVGGAKYTSYEGKQVSLPPIESFSNLVYYMAGYAPDATLEDFIEAYKDLKHKGLVDLPWG